MRDAGLAALIPLALLLSGCMAAPPVHRARVSEDDCRRGNESGCLDFLRQPNPELGQAAVQALRRARFRPARVRSGDAVTHTIRYKYTFKLVD